MSDRTKNTRVARPVAASASPHIHLSWGVVPAITTEELSASAGAPARIIATDGSGIGRIVQTDTPNPSVEDHARALVGYARHLGFGGVWHGSPMAARGQLGRRWVWIIEAGSEGK